MSRPLGSDEGFKKGRFETRVQCPCGRGIPARQWVYTRAGGAIRCVHCQIRARHSTMTAEESEEMLSRIFDAIDELAKEGGGNDG